MRLDSNPCPRHLKSQLQGDHRDLGPEEPPIPLNKNLVCITSKKLILLAIYSTLALCPGFVSSVNQSDPARWTDGRTDGRGRQWRLRRWPRRGRRGRKAMRAGGWASGRTANRRARDRCKGRDERGIKYRHTEREERARAGGSLSERVSTSMSPMSVKWYGGREACIKHLLSKHVSLVT